MRLSRKLSLPLLALLAAATGCARCSGAKAAPERFMAADDSAVVIVPTLGALSRQTSDILATLATFPRGGALLDGRAVVGARLGFDPLDAAALAANGLDPKRGAAIGVRGLGGMSPQPTFTLPVADAGKFDAMVTRIAQQRLAMPVRAVVAGKPEIVTYANEAGAAVGLAYAIAEGTAIVAAGPEAEAGVKAALAVPADKHLGTTQGFKTAMAAVGPDLAAIFYVPAGSDLAKNFPQYQGGVVVGLRGAKDRFGFVVGRLLGTTASAAPPVKGDSAALLAKLDPAAALLARSDSSPQAFMNDGELRAALQRQHFPEELAGALADGFGAMAPGAVLGVALVPVTDPAAQLREAPLGFFRAEGILTVKDAAKMKDVVKRLLTLATQGQLELAAEGPWTFPLPGGEASLSVEGQRLYVAAGPAGALKALIARSGSTFKPPTPTSASVLQSPLGGLVVDVPRLAAGVKAIPASAYGDGGEVFHANVQGWATTASRITAVSVSSELVPGAQRGEIIVEVAPAK
jgi:hypothetical protein